MDLNRLGYLAAVLITSLIASAPMMGAAATHSSEKAKVPTLARVQSAGELRCGIVLAPEDWNKEDLHGDLSALDLEVCKAVGVAALADRVKLKVLPFNGESEAEEGLSSGRVDLVVGVTPTASATWRWHVGFGPPVFYDSLTLLVHADVPGDSLRELAGRKICVIDGTDNDRTLEARIAALGSGARIATWQEEGEMDDAMSTHWCDAVGAYRSRLAPLRRHYRQLAQARLLDESLTLAPVAPAYRQDDPAWGLLVDTTVHMLIAAEELGIDHASAQRQSGSTEPAVARLTGTDWAVARAVGVMPRKDWAAQVITVVGNYGEIYDRTVGESSAAALPRGLNALWTHGGLMNPLMLQ
jgi:general L-amino acid transport system substrate-binding protein